MNKVVLITGGSRGIGKEIVKQFAENNYFVIFTYLKNQTLAHSLKNQYKNIDCYQLDVRDTKACQKLICEIIDKYRHIDCLINNAGVSQFKLAMDCNEEDYNFVMDTNFKGVFNMTSNVLPYMSIQNYGRIINMSSIWGQTGSSFESLYSASKGAIDSFTKSIAKEMAGKNITVNAVSPGMIDTDMNSALTTKEIQDFVSQIPMQRQGRPEEVAKLCLYLANDSGYINGQIVAINGGLN